MKNLIKVLCFLFISILQAQAPKSFNYQAVARDFSGAVIVNKEISVQFKIIKGNAVGKVLYQEMHSTVTNNYGLFTLKVGEGKTKSSGGLGTISWAEDSHWLEVAIDIEGGNSFSVIGTSQLLSVPYALHAETVTNDKDTQYTAGKGLQLIGNEFSLINVDSNGKQVNGSSPFSTTSAVTSNVLGDISRDSFVFGSSSINDVSGTNDDKRVIFCKNEGAFRAGEARGSQWNITNIGDWSVAFGKDNIASGTYSSSFGYLNTAKGISSIATGYRSVASGNYTIALGTFAEASGFISTSIGYDTDAIGKYSTALGFRTKSSGEKSVAIGDESEASGIGSVALGQKSKASGDQSFAGGSFATAEGSNSVSFGYNSISRAPNSSTFGSNTESTEQNQFVIGQYNFINNVNPNVSGPNSRLFVIGNGLFSSARSNAFYVERSGNAVLAGTLTQNSDRRLKVNITPLKSTLEKIEYINGVNYVWKDTKKRGDALQLGVIAQEVQAQYPELVKEDEEGILSVNYNGLVPVLLEAIKELKSELEVSERQNKNLSDELSLLTSKVNAIISELDIDITKG
ncbi:tail fiber domain-containing protein [Aquimarina sp. SS2-1]|uniref:tail fiber domain-containing protein n=1 Tax=Aquimarina besae TaxID=3342247 RepID=UPI00367248CF